MIHRCLALAFLVAATAHAQVVCDSPAKGLEVEQRHQTWRQALADGRFRELDAYYSEVLQRVEAGKLTDLDGSSYFSTVERGWKARGSEFSVKDEGMATMHREFARALKALGSAEAK